MSFLDWLQRRQTRRIFKKYVSPEVLALLESRDLTPPSAPSRQHFQFVIVHIDEANPDRVSEIFGKVVDCFGRHNAILASSSPSLLIGALGFVYPQYDSPELRKRLVGALLDENSTAIHLAHGQADGLTGIFGTSGHFSYSVLVPNFSGILKRLLETPFGSAIEID